MRRTLQDDSRIRAIISTRAAVQHIFGAGIVRKAKTGAHLPSGIRQTKEWVSVCARRAHPLTYTHSHRVWHVLMTEPTYDSSLAYINCEPFQSPLPPRISATGFSLLGFGLVDVHVRVYLLKIEHVSRLSTVINHFWLIEKKSHLLCCARTRPTNWRLLARSLVRRGHLVLCSECSVYDVDNSSSSEALKDVIRHAKISRRQHEFALAQHQRMKRSSDSLLPASLGLYVTCLFHTHTFSCCSYYVQRGTLYTEIIYNNIFTFLLSLQHQASMYNVFIL